MLPKSTVKTMMNNYWIVSWYGRNLFWISLLFFINVHSYNAYDWNIPETYIFATPTARPAMYKCLQVSTTLPLQSFLRALSLNAKQLANVKPFHAQRCRKTLKI